VRITESDMFSEITECRISGSTNLITVLSLGEQYLTGVFPKAIDEKVTKGPLDLVGVLIVAYYK